MLGVAVDRKSI